MPKVVAATVDEIIMKSLNDELERRNKSVLDVIYAGKARDDTPELISPDDIVAVLSNGAYFDGNINKYRPRFISWYYRCAPTYLYDEISKALANWDYTWDDIRWVGSYDVEIPLDTFKRLAQQTYYVRHGEDRYSIPRDLIINMNDCSIFRRRFGQGWNGEWEHNVVTRRPSKVLKRDIKLIGSRRLAELLDSPADKVMS